MCGSDPCGACSFCCPLRYSLSGQGPVGPTSPSATDTPAGLLRGGAECPPGAGQAPLLGHLCAAPGGETDTGALPRGAHGAVESAATSAAPLSGR